VSPASVKKMKELTKQAKEQNKVISVSEAFKMYPVEEEAHKGNLEKSQM
jgi:predicted RND superfamily exporter protein